MYCVLIRRHLRASLPLLLNSELGQIRQTVWWMKAGVSLELLQTSLRWCVSRLPSTWAEHRITRVLVELDLTGCKQKSSFNLFYLFCYAFKHILSWALENLSENLLVWEVTLRFFFNSRSISIRTSTSSHWRLPSPSLDLLQWEPWGVGAGDGQFPPYAHPTSSSILWWPAWIPTLTQSSDGVEMGGERKARKVSLDL